MTNEEILEGNKLIAEFMGYQILHKEYETQYMCSSNESAWTVTEGEIVCDSQGREVDDENQEPYYYLELLPFSSSWNWLMPIIDKIDSMDCPYEDYTWEDRDETYHNFMGFNVDIKPKHCEIWEELELDPPNIIGGGYDKLYNSRIEAAWNAVIEFIKWYNKINLTEE